jgi:hypothetical protein
MLTQSQGSVAQRIRSIEKSSELIRNQTHDLLAYSTVPQPTMLPPALENINLSVYLKAKIQLGRARTFTIESCGIRCRVGIKLTLLFLTFTNKDFHC